MHATTASQLSYLLQAAMGQCSTLPAEARSSASVASRHDSARYAEQRHRLREEGRKESLDFNRLVANDYQPQEAHNLIEQEKLQQQLMQQQQYGQQEHLVPMNHQHQQQLHGNQDQKYPMPQSRDADPSRPPVEKDDVSMDVEPRDDPVAPIPPPPPENAAKQRCYKLNLESEFLGLSSSQRQQLCLGPFTEPPPYLTYSSSEDSSIGVDGTSVAIRTAQIFRGITIARDGTILSQNARATRSKSGNKQKKSEKSRQAAKIDKAKDLVEESVATGKAPGTDDPAKMVSLFIVGEYDDMKQLVRDGSKKLRDADGLGDERLFSANRPRGKPKPKLVESTSTAASMLSPRKRASPNNYMNSYRGSSSDKMVHPTDMPSSAPPKLKSHPRDTRSGRNEDRRGPRMQSCNDFVDPRRMAGDEADWGHAWNLWNCGVVGAGSPVDQRSPREGQTPFFEGRDSHYTSVREGGAMARAK